MQTYKIVIGSDNKTHKVNQKKVEQILNNWTDGYTIYRAQGAWKGIKEESVIVEVATNKFIPRLCSILKRELNQEAIAYSNINSLNFI